MLREFENSMPFYSKTVPLIIISGEKISIYQEPSEKFYALKGIKENEIAITVWPGSWSSDVFKVDIQKAISILKPFMKFI